MLPGRSSSFRPDFGRILIGKASKSALRPAGGRPEGRFRGFPQKNPAEIRPGNPISGPEAHRVGLLPHLSRTIRICTSPPCLLLRFSGIPYSGLLQRLSAIYGCGYNSCGCNLRLSEVRSGSFVVDLGPVWGPKGSATGRVPHLRGFFRCPQRSR